MDKKEFYDDISVKSRMESLQGRHNAEARKIVDFLAGYCFMDEGQHYTNGTMLVPMFRVLDALGMHGNDYVYCELLPPPYAHSTPIMKLPLSNALCNALLRDGERTLGDILARPVRYFMRVRGIGKKLYMELCLFLDQFRNAKIAEDKAREHGLIKPLVSDEFFDDED